MVEPFARRPSRQVITRAPKFYLFDVGVAGAVVKRQIPEARGPLFGRAFEHFIFTELAAHSSYRELGYDIRYWRTKSGQEVDFILGEGEVALEVKGTSRVDAGELRALTSFRDEYLPKKSIVVCNEGEERKMGDIRLMPWRSFLAALWAGDIIGR
jgi:predicted AAA+ superfamily ATPase